MIIKSQIIAGLQQLGLKAGDNLIVHSALTSMGEVEGGADTVIDALLEVVGPRGTLVLPCFAVSLPLDPPKTPTNLGIIPETFRKRPGVVRSRNPLSSVAALGPKAAFYIEGHEYLDCPFEEGSPYIKLANDNGLILLLGVDQDRNTTLHCVEALAHAPYLCGKKGTWIDDTGKTQEREYHRFAGPHRNFIGVEPLLRQAGICITGKIGNSVVRLMKGRTLIDFLLPRIQQDPNLFLSSSPHYWDGVWQRGAVRQSRLAGERFQLAVQTGAAGANLSQVQWNAESLGARVLELDAIDGKDINAFDTEELAFLRLQLEKRKFQAKFIRCGRSGKQVFESYLKIGKLFNSQGLVIPLVGDLKTLLRKSRQTADEGMTLYVENVGIGSEEAGEVLAELDETVKFCFNPAHFALMGELPFLQSFRNRVIKKRLGYLRISDVGKDGLPQPAGKGLAEIGELISILRCGGFEGPLVLAPGLGAGFSFAQAAEALWELLDMVGTGY